MRIWEIVPATLGHVPIISENMREADRREIWASDRWLPQQALTQSLADSTMAWTCMVNDAPAFMWGVARKGSILSDVGIPWLLGTDALSKVSREFLKQSRGYVDKMQEGFTRLENIVHAENTLSIRWLKWCGFTIEQEQVEQNGEKFFMFWREV